MLPARIVSRIRRTGCCWQWVGGTNSNHYGTVSFRGRVVMVHRLVYEDTHGPIPAGLTLDHLCHNTDCVNPDHLEPVTHAENRRRSAVERCPRCGELRVRYSTGRGYRCVSCHLAQQREYQRRRRAESHTEV